MKMKQIIAGILLVLGLAACGAAATNVDQPPVSPAPTETTGPALRRVTPRATEPGSAFEPAAGSDSGAKGEDEMLETAVEMDGAVLVYERRGGLMGIGPSIHTWRLYADGQIVGSDGRSWQVPPEDIADLVARIEAAGFDALAPSYVPEDTCCDRATHIIALEREGTVRTVTTLDAAEMPAELADILNWINEFLMSLPA